MIRKRFEWQVKRATLLLGERTLIAGALDLDGQSDPDRAFVEANRLADAGAGYLELCAAAIEAGAELPGEAEELRRLVPVLKRMKGHFDIPLAVMTTQPGVAAKAIEHGAAIIHDPSALILDPLLGKVVAEGDAGLILSHMRGTPESWSKMGSFKDPAGSVLVELDAAVNRAIRSGVMRKRLVIDPGFDYGKRKEQNIDLLAGLERLASLNLPLHVAPGQRAWLPAAFDAQTASLEMTAAITALLSGAHIVRTREVAALRAAAALVDELLRSVPVVEEEERPARAPRSRPRYDEPEERVSRPIRVPRATVRRPEPEPEAAPEPGEGGPAEAAPDREPVAPAAAASEGASPEREERPARTYEKREFSDRAPRGPRTPRPYEDRPSRPYGDRPPRPYGDRPPRPYGDRPPRSEDDRPPRRFDDRGPKPYGDRGPKRFDDRGPKPYGDRGPKPYGDRPPRPYGDRPPRPYGDRPPQPYGDRGPKRFDDRGPKPYGDRPPRPYGERGPKSFDDRPPRGPRKFDDRGGDRPFKPRRGPGGPPRQGR